MGEDIFLIHYRFFSFHPRWCFAILSIILFIVGAGGAAYAASGLDQYGGTTSVQCSRGPAPHFYTEKIGNRWWLCDPAGNGFFMKGVYNAIAQTNAQQTLINSKYSAGLSRDPINNWALEQAHRLQAWGFNTFGEYAYNRVWPMNTDPGWTTTGDNTIPVKLPFGYIAKSTHAAFQNVYGCGMSSPMKDMMNGVGSVFTGYRYNFGDYFDPGFGSCMSNMLKNDYSFKLALQSKYNSYLVYILVDEGDQMGPTDNGPDFGKVRNDGTVGATGDGSPNAAWVALVTAPTQTSNKTQGVSYSNSKVYSKQELSKWLMARYSNNIVSLNSAWGSNYSTFDTSGAGWGVGTGILDENGTCPSMKSAQSCWIGDPYTLGASTAFPTAETATMQADMSAFYALYLDQYFKVVFNVFHAAAPGYILMAGVGGWSCPPHKEALTEIGKYNFLANLTLPTSPCMDCTDEQARVDFMARYYGDHPWVNWEGFWAQADSAESAYANSNPSLYTTQAQRGAGYQNMVTGMLNAKDTATGTYHVVGFAWWGLYDQNNEQANWGLATLHDNPYDGKSATIVGNGNDQWGYPSGGETANYGDFLSAVTTANHLVESRLVGKNGPANRGTSPAAAHP